MKIARYWSKGKVEARSPSGKLVTLTPWGWSADSPEEAERRAAEASRRVAERVAAGEPFPRRYEYTDRPAREEIVEELKNDDGDVIATVTRNSYGALILNTRDLMFIDIDVEQGHAVGGLVGAIKGLFGVRTDTPESAAHKKIAALAAARGEYTFRLYRTFAGFRCAVINRRIGPNSPESARLLEEFGADPLYVRLCRNQQSYRARLTPKYWRCGAQKPPSRFPWDTEADERRYRAWEREYEERSRGFAACLFVEQVGAQMASAELKSLINLHDRHAKADSRLELA